MRSAVSSTLASSSRRATALSKPSTGSYYRYNTSVAGPSTSRSGRGDLPPHIEALIGKAKPARLGDKKHERVAFQTGDGGVSNDQREFFAQDADAGAGVGEDVMEDSLVAGLEPGRVVECRRSGTKTLGLILAHVVVTDKQRILLLRPTGEIWPVSSRDVQFIMPKSLISPDLISRCWSDELLQLWAAGTPEEQGLSKEVFEDVQQARREAVMTLRKVQLHTERMDQKLVSGTEGKIGGVEAVWEKWSAEKNGERAGITSVEAADYMLNIQGGKGTKPNTLPAYAAHGLLMQRPDLFLADQGDMWETGHFLVRSRTERETVNRVSRWVEGKSSTDAKQLGQFVNKATKAIKASRDGTPAPDVEWSPEDLDIIYVLTARSFELRSTQVSPYHKLVPSIVKALDLYPDQRVEEGLIAKLLREIGALPAHDSLEYSKTIETYQRNMSMNGVKISGPQDLLNGTELDDLREDFTSHRVYVIDDPTASELDDGVSLERVHGSSDVWVHIHVADPTRYISPSHPLSVNASFQGSSLYLPEGGQPLFDNRVIMQELSLGAKVQNDNGSQGVMTFSARLNDNGDVQETKVALGWIKNPRVITYESVDLALDMPRSSILRPLGSRSTQQEYPVPELNETDIEDLRILRDLAVKHRARRFAETGLESFLPVGNVSINSQVAPLKNIYDRSNLPSKPTFTNPPELSYSIPAVITQINAASTVAEMMIIAGQAAGKFCVDHNVPVMYRGSPPPSSLGNDPKLIENLLASRLPGGGHIDYFTQTSCGLHFGSALTDIKPLDHWSMGLKASEGGYLRATSPLRRFEDMITHWQIKSALAKGKGLKAIELNENEVVTLGRRAEDGNKRARRAGKSAQAYWRAGLFMSRLHRPLADDTIDLRQPLRARIAGSSTYHKGSHSTAVVVHLTDLGCLAQLSHGGYDSGNFQIGDEVSVKIDAIEQWPSPQVRVKLA